MRRPPFRKAALALAAFGALAGAASAGQLPRLEADSLGGFHVVLPDAGAGKPLVLLLAFTKESEDDLRAWSRKLLDDHVQDRAAIYVVVVADRTAFVSHKHIRRLAERAAVGTKDQIEHNVLVTFDGTGWRDLVPPGDKRSAGIVVCDPSGSIVYAKREAFTAANLADVERAAK